MIVLQTNYGDIVLELDFEKTPVTSANFLQYVKNGFYDGTIFHRVIDGFMIQGGGFDQEMQQKPVEEPIENEADKASPNKRGTIAMARTSDPHSATAQFFINVVDNKFLDHRKKSSDGWGYCVFGQVLEGMDIVDQIKQVDTTSRHGHQDVPKEPVVIKTVIVKESATTN